MSEQFESRVQYESNQIPHNMGNNYLNKQAHYYGYCGVVVIGLWQGFDSCQIHDHAVF